MNQDPLVTPITPSSEGFNAAYINSLTPIKPLMLAKVLGFIITRRLCEDYQTFIKTADEKDELWAILDYEEGREINVADSTKLQEELEERGFVVDVEIDGTRGAHSWVTAFFVSWKVRDV